MCFKQKGGISIKWQNSKVSEPFYLPEQQHLIYSTILLTGYRLYRSLIYPIKTKQDFFQAMTVHTNIKRHFMDANKTHRENTWWEQFKNHRSNTPTKQQLYCHLPPISLTIQVRRTKYAGSLVDSLAYQQRLSSSLQPRRLAGSNEWSVWMERERES